MAASLVFAPVVYPWYLLYFTPFLLSGVTFPLITWTVTVLGAYLVWYVEALRRPWVVPPAVLVVEYGLLIAAALFVLWRRRTAKVTTPTKREQPSLG
jgi:hypothetical protein